jgi:hypothetical protein
MSVIPPSWHKLLVFQEICYHVKLCRLLRRHDGNACGVRRYVGVLKFADYSAVMFKFLLHKDLRGNDYSAVILKCSLRKRIRKIGPFLPRPPCVCALGGAGSDEIWGKNWTFSGATACWFGYEHERYLTMMIWLPGLLKLVRAILIELESIRGT